MSALLKIWGHGVLVDPSLVPGQSQEGRACMGWYYVPTHQWQSLAGTYCTADIQIKAGTCPSHYISGDHLQYAPRQKTSHFMCKRNVRSHATTMLISIFTRVSNVCKQCTSSERATAIAEFERECVAKGDYVHLLCDLCCFHATH